MLIISHEDFVEHTQPFTLEKLQGIPTTLTSVSEIGGSDEIYQYINEYYNNGIAYVLLVGDIDQIASIRRSEGDGSRTTITSNSYTFIAGDDFYPDLIMSRFSAENSMHVETMVSRTISYEMEPDLFDGWYKKGSGFASNEGPGDDDNEYDYEHGQLRQLLLDYTYGKIDQVYDPTVR